jgi:hypothetical protein
VVKRASFGFSHLSRAEDRMILNFLISKKEGKNRSCLIIFLWKLKCDNAFKILSIGRELESAW